MRGHALLLRVHAIIMRAHAMTNACPRNDNPVYEVSQVKTQGGFHKRLAMC